MLVLRYQCLRRARQLAKLRQDTGQQGVWLAEQLGFSSHLTLDQDLSPLLFQDGEILGCDLQEWLPRVCTWHLTLETKLLKGTINI